MSKRELSVHAMLHSSSLRIAILVAAVCAGATSVAAQPSTSLGTCPARQPVLRIAMVSGGESYSSHPAETRFSSTTFTRLHQMPLIGASPKEDRIDAAYGIAESWSFLPGAKGMIVKLRDGLTFNDGTPITAEDVAFSLELAKSKFADPQISGRSPASVSPPKRSTTRRFSSISPTALRPSTLIYRRPSSRST
jgi:ABC-type transport system substrate-binding protein